ncbi:Uncharacterised protein [Vibrio cholerae]|nr:Uncharacterised protein [Vibrio cholerae]
MRDSNKKSPSKEGLATQLSLFGQFAFSRALGPRQPVLYLRRYLCTCRSC